MAPTAALFFQLVTLRVFWRWSADKAFIQMLGEEELAPGESLTYEERFEGSLAVGTYTVVAIPQQARWLPQTCRWKRGRRLAWDRRIEGTPAPSHPPRRPGA